jgi:hypothetical protein
MKIPGTWLAGEGGKCKRGACGGNLYLDWDWRMRLLKKCLLCSREELLSDDEQKDLRFGSR